MNIILKYRNKKLSLTIKIGFFILAISLVIGFVKFVSFTTVAKPVAFTELYFVNHGGLPKNADVGETRNFAFTVHNLENTNMDYSFEVYLLQNGQRRIIDEGVLNLKNNEFGEKEVSFELTENVRAEVVVELTNKQQSIHFWLAEI